MTTILAIACIWLSLSLLIAVHETGHTLVSKMLGEPIDLITIGITRVFSFWISATKVEIGLMPLMGSIHLANRNVAWYKSALITVAGPLTSFGFSMLLYYAIGGNAFLTVLVNNNFWIVPIIKSILTSTSVLPTLSSFPPIGIEPKLGEILVGYAGINLVMAILNAFPIPPLDGGKFVFSILEGIFGKKVNFVEGLISLFSIVFFMIWMVRSAFVK